MGYHFVGLFKGKFGVKRSEESATETRKNLRERDGGSWKRIEDLADSVRKGESSPTEAWRSLAIALTKM